jgi:hypothetical protein
MLRCLLWTVALLMGTTATASAAAWSGDIALSPRGNGTSLDITDDGLVHVAWRGAGRSGAAVVDKRGHMRARATFGVGADGGTPQVAALPGGRSVVGFDTNRGTVGFAVISKTGKLGPIRREKGSDLTLVATGDRGAVAAWSGGGKSSRVLAMQVSRTGSFGPTLTVADAAADPTLDFANRLYVDAADNGDAAVVWDTYPPSDGALSRNGVALRRVKADGTLGPLVSVAPELRDFSGGDLLGVDVRPDGSAVVSWVQTVRSADGRKMRGRQLQMRVVGPTDSLGPIRALDDVRPGSGLQYQPALALDDGRVLSVAGARTGLYSRWMSADGTLAKRRRIFAGDAALSSSATNGDDVVIAWQSTSRRSTVSSIYAVRMPGGRFGRPRLVSRGAPGEANWRDVARRLHRQQRARGRLVRGWQQSRFGRPPGPQPVIKRNGPLGHQAPRTRAGNHAGVRSTTVASQSQWGQLVLLTSRQRSQDRAIEAVKSVAERLQGLNTA